MAVAERNRGPRRHQVLIWSFTVVLTLLLYWLLGFVIKDIGSIRGPSYPEVRDQFLDEALVSQRGDLTEQITGLKDRITAARQRQGILRESTDNSQQTMNQLLEFQRLNLQKGVTPSAEEQRALAESQTLFLANQKAFQTLNDEIARLSEELRGLEGKRKAVEASLAQQERPARTEFNRLDHRHNIKIASLKLSVLIPLLLIALFFFFRTRGSVYAPLIYASGVALSAKVLVVIHDHFPERYFKYILTLVALGIVLRILVYLLRMVAFPKTEWLLKQYREGYEKFFCPKCGYPIRRGPLRYAFWTRRTVKKLAMPESTSSAEPEETYTCPACGTKVYEECPSCKAIRPSLLPVCQSCGAEKELT